MYEETNNGGTVMFLESINITDAYMKSLSYKLGSLVKLLENFAIIPTSYLRNFS